MIEALRVELLALLEHMDIPTMRLELKPEDIRWLNRNLYINNRNAPGFGRAREIVSQLLRSMI